MSSKANLLEAIAGKNRGLLATQTDRQFILSAVSKLEDFNPTSRPTEALELLEGNWRLLYTSSLALLGLGRFPLVTLGQVYQCIRIGNSHVYNIAEILGIPYLEGIVSVTAQFTATSERRIDIQFQRTIIGLKRLMGYGSPTEFITGIESSQSFPAIDFTNPRSEQSGWLDITYLDQDLRISRGNEGSIFILTKAI